MESSREKVVATALTGATRVPHPKRERRHAMADIGDGFLACRECGS
jgi:hypothetical protein